MVGRESAAAPDAVHEARGRIRDFLRVQHTNRFRHRPGLRGGQAGDGSAVDEQGRVYVATGASVDVFAPTGAFLGSIPGPQGLHGTAFGGRDKKTLFGIVFYGTWC
jgi:sugar lactone lactonase YvrE